VEIAELLAGAIIKINAVRKFAAIRRASSFVSNFAADRRDASRVKRPILE
jgi:hypothetical protein